MTRLIGYVIIWSMSILNGGEVREDLAAKIVELGRRSIQSGDLVPVKYSTAGYRRFDETPVDTGSFVSRSRFLYAT